MKCVKYFDGEFAYLSNFFEAEVEYETIRYKTSEHAFQAAKSLKQADRLRIAALQTPGQSKRAGRQVELRRDWESVKEIVMLDVLTAKFDQNPDLKQLLIETDPLRLIEGNNWGDTYWGIDDKKGGTNRLGEILMILRKNYILGK